MPQHSAAYFIQHDTSSCCTLPLKTPKFLCKDFMQRFAFFPDLFNKSVNEDLVTEPLINNRLKKMLAPPLLSILPGGCITSGPPWRALNIFSEADELPLHLQSLFLLLNSGLSQESFYVLTVCLSWLHSCLVKSSIRTLIFFLMVFFFQTSSKS